MDFQQSPPLAPETVLSPAFHSYRKSIEHMAPGAVRILRGEFKDLPVLPTEENLRVTLPFNGGEGYVCVWVDFPPPAPGKLPPPVWRKGSLCRLMRAMWVMIGGASRPCEVWPREIEAVWDAIIGRRVDGENSLAALAAGLNLTEGYLGARVNQFLGSSFRHLLAEERTAFAARELVTTNRKIVEIGEDTGISLSQFNRKFFEATGMTPRDYRRMIAPPKMVFRRGPLASDG